LVTALLYLSLAEAAGDLSRGGRLPEGEAEHQVFNQGKG